MIFTAAGLVNEGAIDFAVRKVEREFSPDVVRSFILLNRIPTAIPLFFFASSSVTNPPLLLNS